ncbi:hypothetical protein [Chelatococcus reniformis]|uniref:Uncharacterized protein n=1 Tax=Chelatococcus reniformis TaxID=1494448 RepID=A0A916UNH2_9HYPH|nr:hypothetical protein [Chelatococcus reniformis]GGC78643.1 hypothetical protein GCM10010994_41030 [Chelatococcus reniformis]
MAKTPHSRPTSEQLRHQIDSGKTGDKVPGSDPAAAPLGTDDEAGGHPNTDEQIGRAQAQETSRDLRSPKRN